MTVPVIETTPATTITHKSAVLNSLISSDGGDTGNVDVRFRYRKTTPSEWLSPTGFVDPDSKWINEANAYDGNLETEAYSTTFNDAWTKFLELDIDAIPSDKVKIYGSISSIGANPSYFIYVDAYYNTEWNNIYDGALVRNEWVEYPIGSVQTITAIRVKMRVVNGGLLTPKSSIYESQFFGESWTTLDWQTGLSQDDTPYESLTGLLPVTDYEFQVQAKNTDGSSDWTASETFTTLTVPPSRQFITVGSKSRQIINVGHKSRQFINVGHKSRQFITLKGGSNG